MRIPPPASLAPLGASLAAMVATTSWLPNKKAVKALDKAAFPTIRCNGKNPRFSLIQRGGADIGMYDDNTTPEWALFWSHGLQGTRPKGWTIAHVWPTSDDISAYTNLANLIMVREPFAGLTDKDGPLTQFLRWHSWECYQWKPAQEPLPVKPSGYESIQWRYLSSEADPKALILQRLTSRNNKRTRILRPIMERLGWL